MRIEYKDRKSILKAALGEIPSDTAVTNVKVVNVFTGEILPATVYIKDGFFAHIDYNGEDLTPATETVDAGGLYMIPGLIDAHVHIESSMQTPRNFARSVLPWGTTTVVTDPHEMANVYGIEGVEYMYDSSEGLPMRQYVNIPSCVPAVPQIEVSGADFTYKEISKFFGRERVVGLAEVMDFLAVIHDDDRMADILKTSKDAGLYLQGHAPNLPARWLSAYLAAGPKTCHETRFAPDALNKFRYGMYVDARESSITKNVKTIVETSSHFKFFDTFTLCTDDREPDDILEFGHMNDVVNKAIEYGMEPITAIKSATINNAREMNIENLGAVAPGYVADFLLCDSLEKVVPSSVYFEGKLVAKDRVLLATIEDKDYEIETRNSMNIAPLTEADFLIKAEGKSEVNLNMMSYASKVTPVGSYSETRTFPVTDGIVGLPEDPEISFVAVFNRYGHDRKSVYPVLNFGIEKGAVASTVSHDCHNLIVVYKNAKDAVIAANELISCGGGMCATLDGEILHTLKLRVGGLMSTKDTASLAEDASLMKEADRKVGLVDQENPLLRIATIALPVIPIVKMSDMGLIEVNTKKIIPLFAD